jgi:hypothetical protein
MMMFTTVNSYSQTLKQIALKKMELNNSETVKTGLIDKGVNCNYSLRDDDGINIPQTSAQTKYSAYGYNECFTRDDYIQYAGAYEEDWAQPAPVPVVSPVAVKDEAVLYEEPASASTFATSPVLVTAVKDTAVVSEAPSTSTFASSVFEQETQPVAVKDAPVETYVSSDRTVAAKEATFFDAALADPAQEPAKEATFFDAALADPAQEPAKEAWATDSATDATLLDQPLSRK